MKITSKRNETITQVCSLTQPLSGRCSACGARVEESWGFNIFVLDGSTFKTLYILCERHQQLAETGDPATLDAVEMRIRAQLGWARA